jgi:hypothetical protein
MIYDILKLEDIQNLSIKNSDIVRFKCETCGKITEKKFSTFKYKKQFKCTTCLKKEVKRDTSKATEASRSAKSKEKRKQTFEERYGGSLMGSPIIAEKIKKTNLEKYGVENPYSIPEIHQKSLDYLKNKGKIARERIIKENLEKYGTETPTRIQKLNKTCQEKYGIDNPFQLQKVVQNTINRNIENHNIKLKNFCLNNNLSVLNHDEKTIKVKCNSCGEEFELIRSPFYTFWLYDRCNKCYPKVAGKSIEEKELLNWIKSIYSGLIIENSRQIIPPKEIDIYIPEFKLGIEYNGIYWHTGDRKRHREKWELAQKKDIDLIQIWSSEWRDSKAIIQSIIKNRLGKSIPIFARKCEIKEISIKEARIFAETYHLQGFYPGIYIGLYYNGELVDMSIFCKSRFGNKSDWELTRHCIKEGMRVIGGLSREISFFKKLGNNGSIIDYCDMRLFNGRGHWGFKEIGITPPDMQYSDYNNIIPRGRFQKWRMKNINGFKFDENLTQRQNLLNNGMDFIYGVGHKIFLME